MRIKRICGGSYSLKFDKEIDIEKILEFFKEYSIVFKSSDSVKIKKDKKEIMIFKYGEMLFYNFEEDEVRKIAENLKNV